jgi:hypothetical protein
MVPPVESVSFRNVAVALAVRYLFHARIQVLSGVLLTAVGVVTVAVDGLTLRILASSARASTSVYAWRATRRGLRAPAEK